MSDNIEDLIHSYSVEQLKQLIQTAEDAIEQKKTGEIEALRDQMIKMADQYDMTPEEGINYSGRWKRSPGKPKYRNPNSPEQTWTWRGKRPGWLKQADDIEVFRIPE